MALDRSMVEQLLGELGWVQRPVGFFMHKNAADVRVVLREKFVRVETWNERQLAWVLHSSQAYGEVTGTKTEMRVRNYVIKNIPPKGRGGNT